MLTDKQRAEKLREAINLMLDADALMQEALGDTDLCFETHCGIESLVEDLREDVEDLEARAEGTVL